MGESQEAEGGATLEMIGRTGEVEDAPSVGHGPGHVATGQSECGTVDGDRTGQPPKSLLVDDHHGGRSRVRSLSPFRQAFRHRYEPPFRVPQARFYALESAATE